MTTTMVVVNGHHTKGSNCYVNELQLSQRQTLTNTHKTFVKRTHAHKYMCILTHFILHALFSAFFKSDSDNVSAVDTNDVKSAVVINLRKFK